jgi:tetratricopeptide (TPR) repeat protein
MLDEGLTSAETAFSQAQALRDQGRFQESLDLFLAIARSDDPDLTAKRRRQAYAHALTCGVKLPDWLATEAIAREALAEFERTSDFHLRLGEALLRQERFEEAEASLGRTLELSPANQQAPLLLEITRGRVAVGAREDKVAPWPSRLASFGNLKAVVRRYVLDGPRGLPIIQPDSVFMTLGSCFAQNLAMHLRSLGRTVHATEIGEDVNSTYANRYLLEWAENGAISAATAAIQNAYGPGMRDLLRAQIAESDIFVITLGVAPCFFRKDNGEFGFVVSKTPTAGQHRYAAHSMRMTTVAENVENIRCMMDSIARMTSRTPTFVLTVSPVPLGGTTERASAVLADCVSKSTLRLAAEQVCAEGAGHRLVYWPSFEIVRWLGPYLDREQPPAYAADDGNTRHVSQWLIRQIVKLFVDHHSAVPDSDEVPA